MSLPEFGGMDTGFNYTTAPTRPSTTSCCRTRRAASRGCSALAPGGRRPSTGRPTGVALQLVEKETDVFFYGYGDKFRREWMRELVGEPAGGCRTSSSRSAGATSAATSARRG